jgi:hypothetical protein
MLVPVKAVEAIARFTVLICRSPRGIWGLGPLTGRNANRIKRAPIAERLEPIIP